MKNKKIILVISILTLISFVIGFSYAYFTTLVIGNDLASGNTMAAGTLVLEYDGSNELNFDNAVPGNTKTKTFTVINSGSLPVNGYEINLSKVINTFLNEEIVYEISCESSDEIPCQGINETPIPTSSQLILSQGSIAPYTSHSYTLTAKFLDTGSDQNYNQGKRISFKVTINLLELIPNMLIKAPLDEYGYWTLGYFWDYKEDITSITFEDEINVPVGAYESGDVSESQTGNIMAYIIENEYGDEYSPKYDLYIQSNQEIFANEDSSLYFADFYSLIEINNLNLLNTSSVTNMKGMFLGCSSLTSLDLSTFDTSNVTNMSGMFSLCSSLTSLDLSTFDTSSVTNMEGMFYGCASLTSLDLSNHDFTYSLESYVTMFYQVNRLSIISKDQTASDYIDNNWSDLSTACYRCEDNQ